MTTSVNYKSTLRSLEIRHAIAEGILLVISAAAGSTMIVAIIADSASEMNTGLGRYPDYYVAEGICGAWGCLCGIWMLSRMIVTLVKPSSIVTCLEADTIVLMIAVFVGAAASLAQTVVIGNGGIEKCFGLAKERQEQERGMIRIPGTKSGSSILHNLCTTHLAGLVVTWVAVAAFAAWLAFNIVWKTERFRGQHVWRHNLAELARNDGEVEMEITSK